ncbi:MAG: cobyrinate a,c-diamide synthase [Actinobacteria bacterium]|nr:cobyrinate a,c-diamide synthase [Actinomycetota bacterium]MCL6095972.1 cobyrinate a,c-diamide synthase [Actinomycetota bacterium]
MNILGNRLVIAGTHSGVGKTTVAVGIMAALRKRAFKVGAAKVGPDFIDPGYHGLATGRPSRNLDPWIMGERYIAPGALRAADGTDLLIIEGVMGLFDGSSMPRPPVDPTIRTSFSESPLFGSTAHVANLLASPTVLVVDASSMSTSIAALVQGYAHFHPSVPISGVILNKVAGKGHEELLRSSLELTGIPIYGVLYRDDAFSWRDRHLGLVPVVEKTKEVSTSIVRLATVTERSVDIEGLLKLAAQAPAIPAEYLPPAVRTGSARVAVASGPAFSFIYPDNLERLRQAGAEIVEFDPLCDEKLPEGVSALYIGGGFPEVYAEALAANTSLNAEVRDRIDRGLVTWAECGGMLWLARSMDDKRMSGVLPAEARMTNSLTLGYRIAKATTDNPLVPEGYPLRGHEFHYSSMDPPGRALRIFARNHHEHGGYASSTLIASYLHFHLGADPRPAQRFVKIASESLTTTSTR